MFENPRRGRQARNFTTNVPKILVLNANRLPNRYFPANCRWVPLFPVVAKRTAKDARGNTVGTTEEWRSRDGITVALYVRPTQCHFLLQEYT